MEKMVEFLETDDAAQITGVDVRILEDEESETGPRFVRFSDGRVRYREEDVFEWKRRSNKGKKRFGNTSNRTVRCLIVIDCENEQVEVEFPAKKKGKAK